MTVLAVNIKHITHIESLTLNYTTEMGLNLFIHRYITTFKNLRILTLTKNRLKKNDRSREEVSGRLQGDFKETLNRILGVKGTLVTSDTKERNWRWEAAWTQDEKGEPRYEAGRKFKISGTAKLHIKF